MKLDTRQIDIGAGRTISASVAHPARRTAAHLMVILAHGAGGDMHTPFLSAVHEGLAERGYTAVKFNFPYKEAGRRVPDPTPVLEACYDRVIEALRADRDLGAARIVIGGKSLGGRMASHVAARGATVAGLLFLGYPLHPPGKPDKLRVAHLSAIRAPMLFFAGTRDPLCRLDLLRGTLGRLPVAVTLHVVEGGDHSFVVPKPLQRAPRAVWDEIVTVSGQWLASLA